MKTTHNTLLKAHSGRETSSHFGRILAIGSRLCRAASNYRHRQVLKHCDSLKTYQSRRSFIGFMVVSFLATCLLPVSSHAQAPAFAGVPSLLPPLAAGRSESAWTEQEMSLP